MSFSWRRRLLWLALSANPAIGGQAVVEGVMMRSPQSFAVAVRKPNGSIAVREQHWLSFAARWPFLRLPILRGAAMLVESMYNGMSALNFSSQIALAAEADAKNQEAQNTGSDDATKSATEEHKPPSQAAIAATMAFSLLLAFGIFKGIPHLTTWGLGEFFGRDGQSALPITSPLFHLIDGTIKMCIFVGYITLLSRAPEINRLFMYHGAEHKSVHAYEARAPLDVDHTKPRSTAHPRCGTSLMLLVIACSVLVFAAVMPFVPVVTDKAWLQAVFTLAVKMPLLLPIAGIAYEFQRLAAKHPSNPVVGALIAPGMLMQRLTTREPTDDQLEIALTALRKVIWREEQVKQRGEAGKLTTDPVVEEFPSFSAVSQAVPANVGA